MRCVRPAERGGCTVSSELTLVAFEKIGLGGTPKRCSSRRFSATASEQSLARASDARETREREREIRYAIISERGICK
jgi:hypothetical protein